MYSKNRIGNRKFHRIGCIAFEIGSPSSGKSGILHENLCSSQWRIQDFSNVERHQHTILPNFPINCMKLKETGRPREWLPLRPLLGPPIDFFKKLYFRLHYVKIKKNRNKIISLLGIELRAFDSGCNMLLAALT